MNKCRKDSTPKPVIVTDYIPSQIPNKMTWVTIAAQCRDVSFSSNLNSRM
jgi:hypothetical protein